MFAAAVGAKRRPGPGTVPGRRGGSGRGGIGSARRARSGFCEGGATGPGCRGASAGEVWNCKARSTRPTRPGGRGRGRRVGRRRISQANRAAYARPTRNPITDCRPAPAGRRDRVHAPAKNERGGGEGALKAGGEPDLPKYEAARASRRPAREPERSELVFCSGRGARPAPIGFDQATSIASAEPRRNGPPLKASGAVVLPLLNGRPQAALAARHHHRPGGAPQPPPAFLKKNENEKLGGRGRVAGWRLTEILGAADGWRVEAPEASLASKIAGRRWDRFLRRATVEVGGLPGRQPGRFRDGCRVGVVLGGRRGSGFAGMRQPWRVSPRRCSHL